MKPHQERVVEERIEALVERLNRVAEKNGDDFKYRIEIDRPSFRFEFQAIETADGHCFVSGLGRTIDEAITATGNAITDACEHWGYEDL